MVLTKEHHTKLVTKFPEIFEKVKVQSNFKQSENDVQII